LTSSNTSARMSCDPFSTCFGGANGVKPPSQMSWLRRRKLLDPSSLLFLQEPTRSSGPASHWAVLLAVGQKVDADHSTQAIETEIAERTIVIKHQMDEQQRILCHEISEALRRLDQPIPPPGQPIPRGKRAVLVRVRPA